MLFRSVLATTLPPNLTNVTALAAGGGDGEDFSIFLIGGSNAAPALSLSRSNSVLHLTLQGAAFGHYVVEESPALDSAVNWAFKQNVTLPGSAQATLNLPVASDGRFYRARFVR